MEANTQTLKPQFKQLVTTVEGSGVSRAELEDLGTEELIKYLGNQQVLLSRKVQGILREQGITGNRLRKMALEDLKAEGIPGGVAEQIMKKINQ